MISVNIVNIGLIISVDISLMNLNIQVVYKIIIKYNISNLLLE